MNCKIKKTTKSYANSRQHIYNIKKNKSKKHLITKINKITHNGTNLIPLENQHHL